MGTRRRLCHVPTVVVAWSPSCGNVTEANINMCMCVTNVHGSLAVFVTNLLRKKGISLFMIADLLLYLQVK